MEDLSVMRRMASHLWGEINYQEKVADGAYWFGCAGHGGYIVDVNKYPKLKDMQERIYISYNSSKYRPNEQHFAPLEEDCNWALLEYLYPEIMEKVAEKHGWELETRKEAVLKTVRAWNKEYLKEKDKIEGVV